MKSIDEDLADGLAYGIPACCIIMFIAHGGTANDHQALDRGVVHGQWPWDEWVPCGVIHHDFSLQQQEFSVEERRYV
jgi:hypothetical protein